MMSDNNTSYLGIDIAQATFDVALWVEGQTHQGQFANNAAGFTALSRWLTKRRAGQTQATLEATGRYGEALAEQLHEAGHRVAVVNPARIKAYSQSKLQRNKTDRLDAALILDFSRTQTARLWTPPPPAVRELRELVRRLDDVQGQQQQERNRRHAGSRSTVVQADLADSLAGLEQRRKNLKAAIDAHIQAHPQLAHTCQLLCSIISIGPLTAARLMAETPDIAALTSPKQLVAYAGLSPALHQSGSSVRRRGRLSKKGHDRLRSYLYMPALVAIRHNPTVRTFYERLVAAGKPSMVAVVAAMRKLLHIVYGVLKSNRPFDPAFPPPVHQAP